MSVALWFAAFIVLIAVAALASSRGRRAPGGLVSRGRAAALAVLFAALVAATPWVWGGSAAADGLAARLREGVLVRLSLAGIAVDTDAARTIGWSPAADLRLPGDESDTGDLVRIVPAADAISVEPAADSVLLLRGTGDPLAIAAAGLYAGRCPATPAASQPLAAGAITVAIACRDGSPRSALAIRRTAGGVELVPLRWRSGRFRLATLDVRAGDVLQLGAVGAGVPGVTSWEMPALAGHSALLAVPADPTGCPSWADALGLGATATGRFARAAADGGCTIGDGTFTLLARPIAPDAAAVLDRGGRVALAIAGPILLLVFGFAASRGSRRRAGTFGALSRVAVVAVGLTALLAWRLVWAHRIDVLRDLDPDGTRVTANLMSAALVAASLAGVATSRLLEGTTLRLAAAFATWSIWLGAAFLLLDVPLSVLRPTPAITGQLGLSLLAATGLAILDRVSIRDRLGRALGLAQSASARRPPALASVLRITASASPAPALAHIAPTFPGAPHPVAGHPTPTEGRDEGAGAPSIATEPAPDAPASTGAPEPGAGQAAAFVSEIEPGSGAGDPGAGDPGAGPEPEPEPESVPVTEIASSSSSSSVSLPASPLRTWLAAIGPGHVLLLLAALAVAVKMLAPRLVLAKLGLAYAVVIVGHAALRSALAPGRARRGRAFHGLAVLPAVAGVAALDVGVALVIVGVGLALALIVAGHDAVYDAAQAPRLGVLEREHARLVGLHGVAALGAAIAAIAWAVVATDQELLERSTLALLHAPLVAAALFAAAATIARLHRRPWAPWLAAALAALALWGARDAAIARAVAADGVGAHRVAVVVDPGYALLRDDHRFVASVSAWREAALPATVDTWTGQGLFGARLADPGVIVSVENDYLPVLVARERGVGGLVQTTLLLLALVVAAGASAAARLGHASRAHRARWLVAAVAGALCVYQPLAALGVLPLTGISWPGLGIDSPADLWLVVLGLYWLFLGGAPVVPAAVDERIRAAPRLRRARRLAIGALAIAALAGVGLVARAGASALGRAITAAKRGAASGDARVDRALAYAASLACPWDEQRATDVGGVVPTAIDGAPTDASTRRFAHELATAWTADRPAVLAAIPDCAGTVGRWRLARDGETCRATFAAGWPEVTLAITHTPPPPEPPPSPIVADAKRPAVVTTPDEPPPATDTWHATCAIALPDDAVPLLAPHTASRPPRIRLVSAPIGDAATDVGELITPGRIVRLRPAPEAPAPPTTPAPDAKPDPKKSTRKGRKVAPATLPAVAPPPAALAFSSGARTDELSRVSTLELAPGVTVDVRAKERDVVLRGPAEVLVASRAGDAAPSAWRRQAAVDQRVLDRLTLIVAGQRVWLFRPPRAFATGAAPTVDPLLADDVRRAGERARRAYVYGSALPELGWTNPYDVDHSLGLDGWVHAALAPRAPTDAPAPATCGTLAPPPIPRDRVCAPSPLDGVLECRVALQPELALSLAALSQGFVDDPAALGQRQAPTRAAFVVMRGDTGELLAQGDVVPGRGASAYAPADAAAETRLVRLREDRDPLTGAPGERGESDGERADWSLPIAVGSTFKPVVARAAEQAFPADVPQLLMTAIGAPDATCPRRGRRISPLLGHCPPTPLTGEPTTADLHDFLARSPNWYMAALGMVGLGLGNRDAQLAVGAVPLTLSDVLTSDLAAWPVERRLTITDADGPIVTERGVVVGALARTKLWNRIEAVLGRPLCTLGDQASCRRAAERRDLCAARALPIASPTRDLRHLVALGPDRIDFYGDRRPDQKVVATREYFQLLRGSGVHPIGSLAQLTDAFGRVVYDPTDTGAMKLAASWFPTPAAGTVPTYTCRADTTARANTVRGADGGLCAVVARGGTANAALAPLLTDSRVVIYGAKTGTIDSLADIGYRPKACAAWNKDHTIPDRPADRAHQPGWLDCGVAPPDDSLFVLAFGVVTPTGTVPITLGVQLQRGGKGAAGRAAVRYAEAIAAYIQ